MHYAQRVDDAAAIRLKDFNPDEDGGLKRNDAEPEMESLGKELDELEEILFAAGRNSMLIVLQGIDTSGKDGTIRNLLFHMNVQTTRVVPFKVPTLNELAHDFLWRIHQETPPRGGITIFNRSHYEDVIAVRVHDLLPEKVWRRRFDAINHFEQLLANSGTIILKFFLHISKAEQKERLIDREKEATKAWKLNVGDWKERELWDSYMEAYEEAISRCSAPHAPWFVVPANRKWHRNLAVMQRVVEALRPYKKDWLDGLEKMGKKAKDELERYRKEAKIEVKNSH